jgi:hypothetical protein
VSGLGPSHVERNLVVRRESGRWQPIGLAEPMAAPSGHPSLDGAARRKSQRILTPT